MWHPRCISRRRSPWPHLSRTWSRSGWSSHWVQRALNRGDSGGRSSETGTADRVGSLRTLPSELVVPTGRNWAHMTWKCTPKSSKNGGGGYRQDPEGLATSFWFWGGGQTITWFFIFFPYRFYHGFFVGDCSKFCVKKMKSTVRTATGTWPLGAIDLRVTRGQWNKKKSFFLFHYLLRWVPSMCCTTKYTVLCMCRCHSVALELTNLVHWSSQAAGITSVQQNALSDFSEGTDAVFGSSASKFSLGQ